MTITQDDLKAFVEVAGCQNMTRASEKLGVTQPTLSYQIKRLEKEMGVSLFVRHKNGVKLNRAGERFYSKAEQHLALWNEIKSFVLEETEQVSGLYSLGCHPSVAIYTLKHFLPEMLKQEPNINFKIVHDLSRVILEKIIDWKLDFGLVINPVAHPDLVIKKLCVDEVTFFKTKKTNDDVLIYDPNLKQCQHLINKFKWKEFKRHIHSSNLEVVRSLASQGGGIAILPERVAAANNSLMPIPKAPKYKDELCWVYRHDRQKTKGIRWINEWVSKVKI